MQPARVLNKSSLPVDRHCQEKSIQTRVVETLSDISAGGDDKPAFS